MSGNISLKRAWNYDSKHCFAGGLNKKSIEIFLEVLSNIVK